MDLTLPATAELASFHQLNDQLAVHASINWTDWSSFKELVADFPDKSDLIKSENWEDNYRFAVGTTYKLDQNGHCAQALHTTCQRLMTNTARPLFQKQIVYG